MKTRACIPGRLFVRTALRFAPACLALAPLFCARASALTVRTKADMRLWETVPDRTRPLEWPWLDGADSATIFFSNRLDAACALMTVPRGADDSRGGCAHPVVQSGTEALVDATLVQTADGVEVSRDTATLAYVSGAGGGPVTVRANPGTLEWKHVSAPRVHAFDPAWYGETGESGYDIARSQFTGHAIILR